MQYVNNYPEGMIPVVLIKHLLKVFLSFKTNKVNNFQVFM